MGFSLSIDKSAEIHVDARIRINVDPQPQAPIVRLTTIAGGITHTHQGATNMAYTLPLDRQVRLRIGYVDAGGNEAAVDGAVVWDSSDEEIARCESAGTSKIAGVPDNGEVILVPGGKLGNCQISAQADADMGEGIRHIVTLLDVTVVGGEAVSGTITPVGEQEPIA